MILTIIRINNNPRILFNIVDIGCYEFTNEPIIWTSVRTLDFGDDVLIDTFVTSTFVVGNAGDEALNGSVQQIDPPFFIDSGSPYSIASLTNSDVSIMFAPSDITNYSNTIILSGEQNVEINLTGNGIPEPVLFIIGILIFLCSKIKTNNE